ncbi:hypothetical protein NP233_g12955 [Leucocoprinus birnbaumii]|uniref:Nephrocystin 3-like N-terminal domain-containing protein n=1 Tax=Leucocoprinus birnbaumii TaxID=56174 RepID=A0AAD5YPJ1_9AGAR|nr:hypothetical protein NP233_g12955 [Leucocoprinus birnbaumii]
MYGPFGVGKSAIAQTCADALADEDALGGSLFFSRPNNRNNPDYVFPSLAYQFALNSPEFADLLEQIILKRPTLLTAARHIQFEEFIVKPLRQVAANDPHIQQWTVILDGLDEVDGTDAQCDIINIVVASIRDQTTPFRWFIISRPESHIRRAMQAEDVTPILSKLDIPVSPEDDHEILTFFTKELEKIRKQYNLPPSWCSEADFAALVKFASGLWVCVDTVVRFIGSSKSLGPMEQLRLVLSVAEKSSSVSANPLAAMDSFYDLIMRQIPSDVVLTVRKILLLNLIFVPEVNRNLELANALGLTREGFYAACDFLQSVLCLQDHEMAEEPIHFYHASFMEYMKDNERSGEHWIYGDCLEGLRQEVIRRVNDVHSRSTGILSGFSTSHTTDPSLFQGNTPVTTITFPRPPPNDGDHFLAYRALVFSLIQLCDSLYSVVSPSTATLLINVNFSRMRDLLKHSPSSELVLGRIWFERNLPIDYRRKIIRRSRNPLHIIHNVSFILTAIVFTDIHTRTGVGMDKDGGILFLTSSITSLCFSNARLPEDVRRSYIFCSSANSTTVKITSLSLTMKERFHKMAVVTDQSTTPRAHCQASFHRDIQQRRQPDYTLHEDDIGNGSVEPDHPQAYKKVSSTHPASCRDNALDAWNPEYTHQPYCADSPLTQLCPIDESSLTGDINLSTRTRRIASKSRRIIGYDDSGGVDDIEEVTDDGI